MATLVLTALGTAVGGPIGGSIGALIGQQVDARILRPGGREGPRLRDLAISTSSYGQAIPRQFGRMRVPGTVIWSTDLVESKRKEKARKGQPSTTAYSYSASFAVALSSTPIIRIGRIWADGNLLRGAHEDLKVGGTLRFYRGFGDDPVDPLIAAAKGSEAPAFRDCAYVVFENLELGDYGNRIPALSFEIFADGGEETVSLARLVPGAAGQPGAPPLAHARGFADEGGPLAATLAAIDQAIPLVCVSGEEGLELDALSTPSGELITLPDPLSPDAEADGEARHKQRAGIPARTPAAVRYYDEARDYQTGVQRAIGVRTAGRELMIDLPATLTASGARQLANDSANRARWQHETVTWRIGELDPRIAPGVIVRLPGAPGQWFLRSWEWFDRGIALELERLAPPGGAARPSDPGQNLAPPDLPVPASRLAAIELPPETGANPSEPSLFAAASADNSAWRGAALFAVQGNTLAELGTTGSRRAVMGALAAPLAASPALLFEPRAHAEIVLVAADLGLPDTDIAGLARGANRLLIGNEMVQFQRAEPLGAARWRISGLLRGRGGTEPAALIGHPAGALVVLVDDVLIPLDPMLVPPLANSQVAAIGTGDAEPVIARLANAGLSRRPLGPVHPQITQAPDGALTCRWTRRARGQWRWDDSIEVPLIEEREEYFVGYGRVVAPHAAWRTAAPAFGLSAGERADLVGAHGSAALWVRQVGTFDLSPPLLLTTLS